MIIQELKYFFPETLYARFVEIDFKHYTPTLGGIDDSLIQFSEFLASFWNKINSKLMKRYPTKNKFDNINGNHSGEDTPLTIPNREVKLTLTPMVLHHCGRVGSCQRFLLY